MFAVEEVFGITVRVVVIVLSQPAAFEMCVTYVPEVVCAEPPGGVYDCPSQIEMFAVDDVFGITVRFVVMVLSHPAAFEMCVTYVPEVVCAEPPGGV